MAMFAHLALQHHGILPHEYLALPEEERAFLAASDLRWARQMQKAARGSARARR